jgi:hypothetical protein
MNCSPKREWSFRILKAPILKKKIGTIPEVKKTSFYSKLKSGGYEMHRGQAG